MRMRNPLSVHTLSETCECICVRATGPRVPNWVLFRLYLCWNGLESLELASQKGTNDKLSLYDGYIL